MDVGACGWVYALVAEPRGTKGNHVLIAESCFSACNHVLIAESVPASLLFRERAIAEKGVPIPEILIDVN